jgi:hypothetical protein
MVSGQMVSERLLYKGLYGTTLPTIHKQSETKAGLIERIKKSNFIEDKSVVISAINQCELIEFELKPLQK